MDLANAAGKGPTKDDALLDLQDRIVKDAAEKKKHSCDNECGTGTVFCFTTVKFGDSTQINYASGPVEEVTDLKTGKKYPTRMIIAQYAGKVTLTCHCFGVIQYLAQIIESPRERLQSNVSYTQGVVSNERA